MKLYKNIMCRLLPVLLIIFLSAGCGLLSNPVQPEQAEAAEMEAEEKEASKAEAQEREAAEIEADEIEAAEKEAAETEIFELPLPGLPKDFALSMVPEYSGSIWADINEDVPFFDEKQMEAARRMAKALSSQKGPGYSYQAYGSLDYLGRCTGACALVGPETLPQEKRGNIGMIKPTGWHTVKYEGIDGNYLYNRCHLIGFQLTGQDANEKNLITGTRAMNVEGMLPYEDSVLAYVKGTGNHVLYRVTPVFQADHLLADGVLMEARSVEDPLVQFCAFCYNVQPGIRIDYATGESEGPGFSGSSLSDDLSSEQAGDLKTGSGQNGKDGKDRTDGKDETDETVSDNAQNDSVPNRSAGMAQGGSETGEWKYIINVNSRKFHRPDCESVQKMSQKNRQGFNGTRGELLELGYVPCKNCNP